MMSANEKFWEAVRTEIAGSARRVEDAVILAFARDELRRTGMDEEAETVAALVAGMAGERDAVEALAGEEKEERRD